MKQRTNWELVVRFLHSSLSLHAYRLDVVVLVGIDLAPKSAGEFPQGVGVGEVGGGFVGNA